MDVLIAPTRHDLIVALTFLILSAPLLLVMLRYRIFGRLIISMNTEDAEEAWRLSAALTALFVFVSYPIVVAKYAQWFWSRHSQLTVTLISFWISLASWALIRYFHAQRAEDDKLEQDIKSISSGFPPVQLPETPTWLRMWGFSNGIVFAILLGWIVWVVIELG